MKKLYIAFCLGFLASGNFAMERGSAKSQDLDKLTFAAIAKDAGVNLSVIIAPKDANAWPRKQDAQTMLVEQKYQKYCKLKAFNIELNALATTHSIVIEPLEIKDFAECTPQQVDQFEEQIIKLVKQLEQQAGAEIAKKIKNSLAITENYSEILRKANQVERAGEEWKKTGQNKRRISLLRNPFVLGAGITAVLIGSFVLGRYFIIRKVSDIFEVFNSGMFYAGSIPIE